MPNIGARNGFIPSRPFALCRGVRMKKKFIIFTLCFTIIFSSLNYKKPLTISKKSLLTETNLFACKETLAVNTL